MTSVAAIQDVKELSQAAVASTYANLVKRIAYHMVSRLPQSVQVEDLIQSGMLGLLDAAKNFKSDKGASFETYASIPIRGAMLDEIRRNDRAPRSVHRNTRMIEEARTKLINELGRIPREQEVANALDLTITEYQKIQQDSKRTQIYAFDDLGLDENRMTESLKLDDASPYEGVARERFMATLDKALTKLPERERIMLSLYYSDGMNLKEIVLIFGISESRVCQIQNQTMKKLNSLVKEWSE